MLMQGRTVSAPGSNPPTPARPNPGGICHPLLRYCKKIRRGCRSTLSAELQATSGGVESGLWLAGLYAELFGEPNRNSRDLIKT